MRALLLATAIAGLCQALYALRDFIDLEPVPRHLWDKTIIQKRDGEAHEPNVTLGDHEQMLWSSGKCGTSSKCNNHSTIVSLVTWTPQDQRIIDMGKFAWELEAVRCTENMMLQFRHKTSFKAVKREWEWVNFNTMRSFVMIADHWKCGKDWSPEPWVVSRATYYEQNLTVLLHAEKSSWKKVTSSYMLDFGEYRPGRPKRQFDFNFDGSFTLNLASAWPWTFINQTWQGTRFTVVCDECGVEGALEFAGHVEGSLLGGLDHLTLSATPNNLGASLNLEATLQGFYNFAGKDWASQEFELFTIPLPSGWRIPGVLTFGPNAKLLAGYELISIAGRATMTAGISASIPDNSIAKLDLIGKETVDVQGWLPTFDFRPPELTEGGVEASGRVWGKLAVAVSLEIFDENGITADLYVRLPLNIEAEVGYDVLGFCASSTEPFGASLELGVGADIGLEAWREVDGKRDVIFEQVIFSDLEVLELPDICLSFGDPPLGSCVPDMDEEMGIWWDNEVDPYREDDADDVSKRALLPPRDSKRESGPEWEYYNLDCDPRNVTAKQHSRWQIRLKPYPAPTEIEVRGEAGTTVPIMKVAIDGCDDPTNINACRPVRWTVFMTENENELNGVTSWNSEHIYEGNWIRNFLNDLQKKYFTESGGCEQLAARIFKIGERGGYADGMLNSVGNSQTYKDMMALFPLRENGYKFRTFSPGITLIDGSFRNNVRRPHSVHSGACALGRLVATCKYMEHNETQNRLKASIRAMDAVMVNMDQDATIRKPGDTTYQAAHRAWFTDMYSKGINKLHEQFVAAAKYLTETVRKEDYKKLPQEIQDVVAPLAGDNGLEAASNLCPGAFVYP